MYGLRSGEMMPGLGDSFVIGGRFGAVKLCQLRYVFVWAGAITGGESGP